MSNGCQMQIAKCECGWKFANDHTQVIKYLGKLTYDVLCTVLVVNKPGRRIL